MNRRGLMWLFAAAVAVAVPAWSADNMPAAAPASNQGAGDAMQNDSGATMKNESTDAPVKKESTGATMKKESTAPMKKETSGEMKSASGAEQSLSAEIKVGTGVENREVTGASESFTAGTPLVGWTRIKGADEPTEVVHEWWNGKEKVASVTLPVKASSWRTYSRISSPQAGDWTLKVVDSSGKEVASQTFKVTAQ